MTELLMTEVGGYPLARILTVASMVLTVALLLWSLSKGKRRAKVRPWFDIARALVQIAAVVAVAWFTGVSTPVGLVVGCVLLGLVIGVVQGTQLRLAVDDGKVFATRSVIGLVIWGGGLVLMQGAGLANRTGLLRLGQGISWFSIGITVGLIVGRAVNLDRALRVAGSGAASILLVAGSAIAVLAVDAPSASAQSCPGVSGYTLVGDSGGNCNYSSDAGDGKGLINMQTSRCGADLAEAWAGLGGQPGSTVHVRADDTGLFPNTDGNTYTRFEKVFVLGSNGIANIAIPSYTGPNRDVFIAAAPAVIAAFGASCAGSPAPTAATGDDPPAAPPATRIVTEDIDPDAPAEFAPIEDEGDALREEQQAARDAAEQEAQERAEAEQAPVTVAPVSPEEFALPEQDDAELDTSGELTEDPDAQVTDNEALAAAVGALAAAAAAGAISWAEAMAQANDLLGEAGYARNAEEIFGRRQAGVDQELRDRYGFDPNEPAADRFRSPPDDRVVIGDGTTGPVGHLWDASEGEWVTPHEAGRRVDTDRAALEDERRRRAADEERRRQASEEFDREAAERAAARRRVEEEEAAARLADLQRRGEAYEQLERIRQAADRRGWGDVVDRIDNAFDEDGNIDPDYVDSLRDVLVNRIGREVGTPPTDPSLLAEFLRDVDAEYGDVIPDFLLDEIQHAMEETYFGDGLQSSLDELDQSAGARMALGMLTAGGSEAYFQSRILGQAIMADIEAAERAGVPYERLQILHAMADTLVRENAPINTAQLALRGENVTSGQLLMAIIGDLGATADFAEAAQTLRGFGDGLRVPDGPTPRTAEGPGGRPAADAPSGGPRVEEPSGPRVDEPSGGRPAAEPSGPRVDEPSGGRPAGEPSGPRVEEPSGGRPAGEPSGPRVEEPSGGPRVEEPDARRTPDERAASDGARSADDVASSDGARSADDVSSGDGARSADDVASGDGARSADDVSSGDGARSADDAPPGDGSRPADDATPDDGGRAGDDAPDDGARSADDGRGDSDTSSSTDAADAGDANAAGEAGGADPSTSPNPEPPDPAKGGIAPEVVNPDGSPVPDIDGVKPGTKLDGDDIRSAGYTPDQGAALRQVAEQHGVIIATRTTNPLSTRFLESGEAVPKPIWLKNKSISELDELIGGPRASEAGKVGFFKPTEPRFLDGSPVPKDHPAWARFEQRSNEFKKLSDSMAELEATGKVRIVDGAVEMRMPDGTYKPFAGDIDPVAILDAKTGKPISGSRYDEVIASLKDSNAQLQHGAEANMINDIVEIKAAELATKHPVGSPEYVAGLAKAEADARSLFESLNQNHLDGKETVIYSHSRGTYKGPQLNRLDGYEQMTAGRSAQGPGRTTGFWDPDAVPLAQQPKPSQPAGLRPRPREDEQ